MAKRLVLDTTKCDACTTECTVKCDYFYLPSVMDHGISSLRELIAYQVVCRRCEEPSCVAACRFQALERQEDGALRRYSMRCVSCKSCSQACPFGTIYPELLPFFVTRCDYCMKSLESGELKCLSSCAQKAIEFREVDEATEKDVFIVNDALATRAPKWNKKDV